MSISLKSLTRPTARPIIATIVGENGLGKTTLAATFPGPVVFIRTEDGAQVLAGRDDVALFPVAKTSQDVLDAIHTLATENHRFKTVVLDSITQLNTIIEHEIIAADGKAKSINQAAGGYGAGYSAAAERHRQIREALGELSVAKNMHVVFIAHSDVETIDLPDQDPYQRYTIRMHKKSVAHYSDNVDLVAYVKLKTFVRGDSERKKAISTGERIITCYPTANHISKNRFGITEDIPFVLGTNPFAGYIPQLTEQPNEQPNQPTEQE